MSWQEVKSRGRRRRDRSGDPKQAAEILRSLFSLGRRPERRPEWKCRACGTFNFEDRVICRKCVGHKGAQSNAREDLRGGQPPRQAPWVAAQAATKRAEDLKVAISAVHQSGVCTDIVSDLQTKLDAEEKKAEKAQGKRSTLSRVEATRGFITRAEKRLSGLQDQISELRKQEENMAMELEQSRRQLAQLEKEAAEDLRGQDAHGAHPDLEEAVRQLMVAMHACTMPPIVIEAVAAVQTALPTPPVSADMEDHPVDGETAPEDSIAPGKLSEALPGSGQHAGREKRSLNVPQDIADLANVENTDEALLSWAKRLKSSI